MTKSIRRVHDAQFKTKVVLEALKGHKTVAKLSSEFGIHAQQITERTGAPVETTSARRYAQPVRVGSGQIQADTRRTRTHRRTSVPTDWTVKGRERLAQKKIANELGSDRGHLVEPAHTQMSVSQQCTLLSIARSSYYYQPVGESVQNLALMERIDKLFMARPEMGVRRMHQELTTEDEPLNIKRIRRLMRLMGLEAVGPKPNLSRPQPGHTVYPYLLRGVSVERVNQVWSTDITYVPMATGFLYLCAVIDWYSRFILSWRLSNTLLADFCVDAMQEALTKWGKPEIFNCAGSPDRPGQSVYEPLIY